MKILLDTHVLLWALLGDEKLSQTGIDLISDPNNDIYYSVISLWEIELKQQKHPESISASVGQLAKYAENAGYQSLDLKIPAIKALHTLTPKDDHKDPFDHILMAQAKDQDMNFVTHDRKIAQYGYSFIIKI